MDCSACDTGYTISDTAAAGSAQTCVANTCTCPNGTPTVAAGTDGTLCDTDNQVDCSACGTGYTISDTAAAGSAQTCDADNANCVLGAAVGASDCTDQCGTLTQLITTAATGTGSCAPGSHACQPGEGACPVTTDIGTCKAGETYCAPTVNKTVPGFKGACSSCGDLKNCSQMVKWVVKGACYEECAGGWTEAYAKIFAAENSCDAAQQAAVVAAVKAAHDASASTPSSGNGDDSKTGIESGTSGVSISIVLTLVSMVWCTISFISFY